MNEHMTDDVNAANILYLQVVQSKSLTLFLVIFVIGVIGKTAFTPSWIFDFLFFGSVYFIFYLISTILTNTLHERSHIIKLQELGYRATNFKVHRVGDVSFSIEEVERMSAKEVYQVASAPFLRPAVYITELFSLLILIGISTLSPFPLDIFLLVVAGVASISFLGSLCAFIVIQKRMTSGFCVILARTVTSKGDIDEIVTWNSTFNTSR